ncbi:putative long-chain-fatty-acid--CoA ligase FadD23 [Posidoniimonas polymericola]|uniref:Putative long-chain-fatty-acid--CoA ligase FadD23 n=1 Tax=Posidoniimonas polymericola TaxID=2528002 RepID=A0A5C5YRV6_9BACT|nr:aminotransferase class I/II-fold pyridoxal phosphate-dependent enzyme [Posidoniimonas polymericola]TWT77704.1 putative long-chain-fatty-acid--CoA ligase FadD23 [Posidoniimonas polymericola]
MSKTEHPRFQSVCESADLVGLLRERTESHPYQRAFSYLVDGDFDRQHLTYGQLDERARAIAAHLQSRGMAGERALLLYPSGLEFIAAFFGCLYAGVTAVPAYPPRRNRNLLRIKSIVADATPGVALTTHGVFDRVEPMIQDEADLRAIPWQCTDELALDQADAWEDPQVDPSTLAFLQYTSGSTGTPKGVMLSHGNLLHNTKVICEGFSMSRAGEGMTWLPLYHDMGLIGGIIQPIYFGRHNTLMTPTHFLQKPIRWLRTLSDTGAMISGGPNFAYELCLDRITDEEKRGLDLTQWEVAFNGAEPVRASTMRRFADAFAECGFRFESFYPCYGLAEATLMVAGKTKWQPPTVKSYDIEALKAGQAKPATAGAAEALDVVGSGESYLSHEVAIVDPESLVPCPDRRVGEIWVKGESVAQGYWKREALSQETFAARTTEGDGPYLRTGDLGFVDEGELFVTGRLKDLIIIRGANHYPQDIELTVEDSHPSLPKSSGAAVTIGEDGEEKLVVLQEMGRQRDLPFEEILDAVRHHVTAIHDVAPAAIVFLRPNTIPKTSSGKIQRHACRDQYLAGKLNVVAEWSLGDGLSVHRKRGSDRIERRKAEAQQPAAAPAVQEERKPSGSTIERTMKIVREVAKERASAATLETEITAMGLDSLERMEIVAGLEDEFGGRFSEEAIIGMNTCRDVVRAVEEHLLSEGGPAEREVLPGDYQFSQSPEYLKLRSSLKLAESAGLTNPYFTQHEGVTNDRTVIGGKEYINWCSYNYLAMSGEPDVQEATRDSVDRYGTSVSASRLVSGEKPLHRELEQAIAGFLGVEDAIVMVGGHATNESVIGHMYGPGDLILHDALSHNSIVQGCKLSGATRRAFAHNDAGACEELLKRYRGEYRQVLIVVEGVYSMDGDFSPLPEFVRLKKEHKAYLMVDEAHSLGTMGPTGRGMSEHFGVDPREVDLWMGTMSKSLGSCGGYIAACREIIEYLKYTAPGFVFSVGLSPANAASALASLKLVKEKPERVDRLRHNSELFLKLAKKAGLNTGMSAGTPIVPVIIGNSLQSLELSQRLFADGINVQPIMYPAVEESAARLRFFITSSHTDEQIHKTVDSLAKHWKQLHRKSG